MRSRLRLVSFHFRVLLLAATWRFMKFKRSCDPVQIHDSSFFFFLQRVVLFLRGFGIRIWLSSHYQLPIDFLPKAELTNARLHSTKTIVWVYTHDWSDHDVINTRRKLFKVSFMSRLEDSHLLLSGSHALFTPWGLNNAKLLPESEPIKLVEIPRQVREYILIILDKCLAWLMWTVRCHFKSIGYQATHISVVVFSKTKLTSWQTRSQKKET